MTGLSRPGPMTEDTGNVGFVPGLIPTGLSGLIPARANDGDIRKGGGCPLT